MSKQQYARACRSLLSFKITDILMEALPELWYIDAQKIAYQIEDEVLQK